MQISVLGPVEVSVDGRPVAIGKGKTRALLVLLALNEGATVSTTRLVEGLWGEDPPPTAAKMVQVCVSRLRKALASSGNGAEIVTRGRGYELRLATSTRVASRRWSPMATRARRWRSGAAHRWPTSRTSRSRVLRSATWRSCAWRRSSWRSSAT